MKLFAKKARGASAAGFTRKRHTLECYYNRFPPKNQVKILRRRIQKFSLLNGSVCVMIEYGIIIRKGPLAL